MLCYVELPESMTGGPEGIGKGLLRAKKRGAGCAQFFSIKASSIACNWNIFLSPDTLSRNFASWSRGFSNVLKWMRAEPIAEDVQILIGEMHGMPKIPDLEPNQTMMTRLQLQKQKKIPANANAIRMHKLDHVLGITSSTTWYPKGHILCSCSRCLHPLAETLWGHTCSNGSKGLLVEGTSFPSQTVTNTALNITQPLPVQIVQYLCHNNRISWDSLPIFLNSPALCTRSALPIASFRDCLGEHGPEMAAWSMLRIWCVKTMIFLTPIDSSTKVHFVFPFLGRLREVMDAQPLCRTSFWFKWRKKPFKIGIGKASLKLDISNHRLALPWHFETAVFESGLLV